MKHIDELYREYETVFVLRPDATEDMIAKVQDRINLVFSKEDGKLISQDDWGKRKLAYEILDRTAQRRHNKGLYTYMQYLGKGNLVAELERNFRLLEPVLRYMTIRVADDVDPEERLKPAAEA